MDVFLLTKSGDKIPTVVCTTWRAAHTAMLVHDPRLTMLTGHQYISYDEECWHFGIPPEHSGQISPTQAIITRMPLTGELP